MEEKKPNARPTAKRPDQKLYVPRHRKQQPPEEKHSTQSKQHRKIDHKSQVSQDSKTRQIDNRRIVCSSDKQDDGSKDKGQIVDDQSEPSTEVSTDKDQAELAQNKCVTALEVVDHVLSVSQDDGGLTTSEVELEHRSAGDGTEDEKVNVMQDLSSFKDDADSADSALSLSDCVEDQRQRMLKDTMTTTSQTNESKEKLVTSLDYPVNSLEQIASAKTLSLSIVDEMIDVALQSIRKTLSDREEPKNIPDLSNIGEGTVSPECLNQTMKIEGYSSENDRGKTNCYPETHAKTVSNSIVPSHISSAEKTQSPIQEKSQEELPKKSIPGKKQSKGSGRKMKIHKKKKQEKNSKDEKDTSSHRPIADKKAKKKQAEEVEIQKGDDWEMVWDDSGECLNEEMLEELKKLTKIESPKIYHAEQTDIDYFHFEPKQVVLDDAFDHLVEIYDFSENLKTTDICMALQSSGLEEFDIKWVDDTHAIAVFGNSQAAYQATKISNITLKVRPVSEGTRATKLKSRSFRDMLLPYKQRPETTASVARNIITSTLGLRSPISREQRSAEKLRITAAKERKKQLEKMKNEAWGD